MDLPRENKVTEDEDNEEDEGDEDLEQLPKKLLAAGPKDNQVMVFKTEGRMLEGLAGTGFGLHLL